MLHDCVYVCFACVCSGIIERERERLQFRGVIMINVYMVERKIVYVTLKFAFVSRERERTAFPPLDPFLLNALSLDTPQPEMDRP